MIEPSYEYGSLYNYKDLIVVLFVVRVWILRTLELLGYVKANVLKDIEYTDLLLGIRKYLINRYLYLFTIVYK